MKLFKAKKKTAPQERQDADRPGQAKYGQEHTKVNSLSTKALVGGVYGLILLGAAGGAVGLFAASAEPAPPPAQVEHGETATAEGAAISYITSWLSATKSDQSLVQEITGSRLPAAPQNRVDFSAITVANVEQTDRDDVVAVTVSALMTTPEAKPKDDSSESNRSEAADSSDAGDETTEGADEGNTDQSPGSVTRVQHWQVSVQQRDGQVQVIGFPTPVPAPAQLPEPAELDYPERIDVYSELGKTLEGFAQSYAAGQGDVSRYLSPGSKIRGVSPTPYTQVHLTDLRSDSDPGDVPAGEPMRVLVQAEAELESSSDDRQAVSFALTVREREGRWEVTAVDPAPAIAQHSE